jgi:hypothetical protein
LATGGVLEPRGALLPPGRFQTRRLCGSLHGKQAGIRRTLVGLRQARSRACPDQPQLDRPASDALDPGRVRRCSDLRVRVGVDLIKLFLVVTDEATK